jgi:hypothetical protein
VVGAYDKLIISQKKKLKEENQQKQPLSREKGTPQID